VASKEAREEAIRHASEMVRSGNPFVRPLNPTTPVEDEPIVAWRGWRLEPTTCTLKSLVWSTPWPKIEPLQAAVAVGREATSDPVVPTEEGHLGIYAWRSRGQLIDIIQLDAFTVPVWGQVSLWGTVIEHELGYRAEFAYPYSLMLLEADAARFSARLRDAYGVEVTSI
jgi:hypothetical protein